MKQWTIFGELEEIKPPKPTIPDGMIDEVLLGLVSAYCGYISLAGKYWDNDEFERFKTAQMNHIAELIKKGQFSWETVQYVSWKKNEDN